MSYLSLPDIKPPIVNTLWFATRNLTDIEHEVDKLEEGLTNWPHMVDEEEEDEDEEMVSDDEYVVEDTYLNTSEVQEFQEQEFASPL